MNLRIDGVDGARLLASARGVAMSAGSACASGSGRPSHVLAAMGLTPAQAKASLRLGWGRFTTPAEIDAAAAMIDTAVQTLQQYAA